MSPATPPAPGSLPGPAPLPLTTHRAPTTCPVCSTSLITLRLGCPSCGTELSGHFDSCRYCRLDAGDSAILEVFLRGRGNVRDVQAHLGVSYPTARARLAEVLDRLGFGEGPSPHASAAAPDGPTATRTPPAGTTAELTSVLADLAAGRLSVADAERLIDEG
jgi:hypothetical protein